MVSNFKFDAIIHLTHEETAKSTWLLASDADTDGTEVIVIVSIAERRMREVVTVVVPGLGDETPMHLLDFI